MAKRKGSTRTGARPAKQRVRTARGRSAASTRWLRRQLNDPYVHASRRAGYRSRAAYKLIELDDRFGLLAPGRRVVDLGAAPGGWSQVAAERVGAADGRGAVIAVDLLPMDAIAGVQILELDFEAPQAVAAIRRALGDGADVVLSDMAAPASGHRPTDHLRVMHLCELALDFAEGVLKPGGAFLCKVLKGGTEAALLNRMKRSFKNVKHAKPPASRRESAESYVVALDFRGRAEA